MKFSKLKSSFFIFKTKKVKFGKYFFQKKKFLNLKENS